MRVFVGEPGYEYKENFRTLSNAALSGGVTSVVTMPNTDPIIDNVSIVDFLKRRGRDKRNSKRGEREEKKSREPTRLACLSRRGRARSGGVTEDSPLPSLCVSSLLCVTATPVAPPSQIRGEAWCRVTRDPPPGHHEVLAPRRHSEEARALPNPTSRPGK